MSRPDIELNALLQERSTPSERKHSRSISTGGCFAPETASCATATMKPRVWLMETRGPSASIDFTAKVLLLDVGGHQVLYEFEKADQLSR